VSIAKSFGKGNKGENLVIGLLVGHGIHCEKEPKHELRYDHDLIASLGEAKFTLEVKYDMMSRFTGNIAIEYRNSKKDAPSGIEVTKANYWVIITPTKEGNLIYASPVDSLKTFIENTAPWKVIQAGGDGNADMYLYKKDVILPVFTLLNNLTQEKLYDYFGISTPTIKDAAE
jgi:hypothetical protein